MHRSPTALLLMSGMAGLATAMAPAEERPESSPRDALDHGAPHRRAKHIDEPNRTERIGASPRIVRFVAMGDGGEGNAAQYAVADAVAAVCAAKDDEHGPGCDFVLYLGDNFYDDGVESVEDEQFQTKFELPYAELDLPFYVVLGNHDYGELGVWKRKGSYEVEYSSHSDKWTMPDVFYSFTHGHARFIGLDTNRILFEDLWGNSGQDSWIQTVLADTTPTWNIAFGHHPYISNGQHGNAGAYEGHAWLPVANGASIKTFVEAHVCGKVDLYLSGHDHNRQWLEPTCGTEFIVTGAAAKTTRLQNRGNPVFFEDDTIEGFVWVELLDNRLTGEIWDRNGRLDLRRTLTRPGGTTLSAEAGAGSAAESVAGRPATPGPHQSEPRPAHRPSGSR